MPSRLLRRRSNCNNVLRSGKNLMAIYTKNSCKRLLPLGLCLVVSIDAFLSVAVAQNIPSRIEIVVVEGEGATSNTRQHVATDPVVRIEDDDHRPVSGVAVTFALPVSGTSGEFSNGSKTITTITDNNGQAAARGLKTNEVPGKLQIYVTASYHGLRARALINQVVAATPGAKVPAQQTSSAKSSGTWKWVLLGVAGAGAAGAAFYFKGHSSSSSTPTPISIGVGAAVFGNPR